MIEINLLPTDLCKQPEAKEPFLGLSPKKLAAYSIVGFIGLQILLTVFAVFKQWESHQMKSEIKKLTESHAQLVGIKAQSDAAKKTIKQVNTLTVRKFEWWQLLNALSDSVTKGVWLRSLSVEEMDPSLVGASRKQVAQAGKTAADGRVRVLRIEGSVVARGEETAFTGRFIKELKENAVFSKLFDSIELSNMNQKKIKDVDVYDFTILCAFRRELAEVAA